EARAPCGAAPATLLRTPRRRPRPPRRGLYANASSIGIVAAATLQVGQDDGRTLQRRELAAPGCQTRPGAGGPSVAGRPPAGVPVSTDPAFVRARGMRPTIPAPLGVLQPPDRRRRRHDRRWGESPACARRRGPAAS